MEFVISLLIFGNLQVGMIEQSIQKDNASTQTALIKESLFISMERTPCFGRCPSFKVKIFNTGRVEYTGDANVEKVGNYSAQLSLTQVQQLKDKIQAIQLFQLADKYDAKITDIPSCVLYVNLDGKKKKIFDRHGAPDSLKEFEKMIDKFVLESELKKERKQNGNKD